jgi:DUF1680 family protein
VTAEERRDLLGDVVVLKSGNLTAIPYYAWAHRGKGEMAIWLMRDRARASDAP